MCLVNDSLIFTIAKDVERYRFVSDINVVTQVRDLLTVIQLEK